MSKPNELAARGEEVSENVSEDAVLGEKQGTLRDVEDMKRMGKEQLFKVAFGLFLIKCVRSTLTKVARSATLVSCPSLALP